MEKLCLIFVKFSVSYTTDVGYKSIATKDIISIKEMTLREASEIRFFILNYNNMNENSFGNELVGLNPTSYQVYKIKNKTSIKAYKKSFEIKDGSYNSTDLDLVDLVRKRILYTFYQDLITETEEVDHKIGNDKNRELLWHFSDLLGLFYVSNTPDLTYQEFKSDKRFINIVNDIENMQGMVHLPSIKEEMSTASGYENQLMGIIGSYLKPNY